MESEQSKNPSEEETPFSVYAKTGLSTEEVAKKLQSMVLTKFLKRKLVHFASLWAISGDPFPG